MAYAGAEFAAKVLRAIKGEKGIVAPSYVNLAADVEGGKVLTGELGRELEYFSAPVELGPAGIVSIRPLGKTTDGEKELIKAALDELAGNIEKVCLFRRARLYLTDFDDPGCPIHPGPQALGPPYAERRGYQEAVMYYVT